MLLHGVLGLHVVCCVLIVGQVDPRQREGFLALEQRILISRRRRISRSLDLDSKTFGDIPPRLEMSQVDLSGDTNEETEREICGRKNSKPAIKLP